MSASDDFPVFKPAPDLQQGAINRRRRFIAASVTASALAALPVSAQERYPSRPIKLIVPFPPGGPTDVFGRRYAERASEALGQPMVIENRAGAGGLIGAAAVAKAPADGYTLLFGSSSTHVSGPLMSANPPYDPIRDYTSIIVGVVPMILAVRPTLQVNSARELFDLIRANPGKFSYSSSGAGSINHLGMELLKLREGGLDALHVPYKGNNPALMALLAGEVDFTLDTYGTGLQYHKTGRMKMLASCGEKRSAVAPEIPTTTELGIPDSTITTVNMVACPSGTPQSIVATLVAATRKVMREEGTLASLSQLGIEPVSDADPVRSSKFFAAEILRWGPIVKASGASI